MVQRTSFVLDIVNCLRLRCGGNLKGGQEDILAPCILGGYQKGLKFILKSFREYISTEDLNIIIGNNTNMELLTEDISSSGSTSNTSSEDDDISLKPDPDIIAKTEMKVQLQKETNILAGNIPSFNKHPFYN